MKLLCDNKIVRLRTDVSEKNSMLITGNSRMGKTFFASNLAADLIREGNIIHLIDLGEKWSRQDKSRLIGAGAVEKNVERQGLKLVFASSTELSGCAVRILNALGFWSSRKEAVLKGVFLQQHNRKKDGLSMRDVLNFLVKDVESREEKDSRQELHDCLDSYENIPDITFCVDTNTQFSSCSTIWDLSGFDDTYVKISTYLIMYCLYCQKKRDFKKNVMRKKEFIVIDECQNLEFDRKSIVGICLAEGQKYGLNLILITQFLSGNFPGTVINQFRQGGFRVHFRAIEEDAAVISGQLAFDSAIRNQLYQKIISLSRGECLFLGLHSIGRRQDVSEGFRFLKIVGGVLNGANKGIMPAKSERRKEKIQNKKTFCTKGDLPAPR